MNSQFRIFYFDHCTKRGWFYKCTHCPNIKWWKSHSIGMDKRSVWCSSDFYNTLEDVDGKNWGNSTIRTSLFFKPRFFQKTAYYFYSNEYIVSENIRFFRNKNICQRTKSNTLQNKNLWHFHHFWGYKCLSSLYTKSQLYQLVTFIVVVKNCLTWNEG